MLTMIYKKRLIFHLKKVLRTLKTLKNMTLDKKISLHYICPSKPFKLRL